MKELAIVNGSVYQDHGFHRTNVYIRKGIIDVITPESLPSEEIIDATGLFVIPGLIDPHVHLSMKNRFAQSADDFESGSIAAAYGGVTTIIDFLDEVSSAAELKQRFDERIQVAQNAHIDFALHAAVKDIDDDPETIASAALELGMPTIKLYTTYKEDGSYSSPRTVEAMIRRSAKGDLLILCHSEKDDMLDLVNPNVSDHSLNRPPESEVEQVREIAGWTRQYRGRAYIVHTSCGSTIEMLKNEFADILGSNLFIEGCPQYFLFNDSVYKGPDAPLYTMTPPIRPIKEQELLKKNWHDINCFATDHCPFLKKYKLKPSLLKIPMGCGGIEHSFSVLHPLFGDDMIDRFTENTARLHGLYPRKGVLQTGSDADITIFSKTTPARWSDHSAADYSIYSNTVRDVEIVTVISRGSFVVRDGVHHHHMGQYLERRLL
ncbi:MAG TPA: amidohydrolase family protein [Clostridia bacterium]|nr:amidohydrolase family protein [Clostridia bacterium]